MHKGPYEEDQREGYDLASETGAAPLTYQFEGPEKGLTETQKLIIQGYFEEHICDNFMQFIKVAPDSLKQLRRLIVAYAPILLCDSFEQFINRYYPVVPAADASSQQNLFFRQLLITFNRLCNNIIDIDHPLYAAIFDPRFSSTKSSSPSKKNLVTSFFKTKINEHFQFSEDDEFISQALAWLKSNQARYNQQPPVLGKKDSAARKQLFFGY
jgi:hypothetical protein